MARFNRLKHPTFLPHPMWCFFAPPSARHCVRGWEKCSQQTRRRRKKCLFGPKWLRSFVHPFDFWATGRLQEDLMVPRLFRNWESLFLSRVTTTHNKSCKKKNLLENLLSDEVLYRMFFKIHSKQWLRLAFTLQKCLCGCISGLCIQCQPTGPQINLYFFFKRGENVVPLTNCAT